MIAIGLLTLLVASTFLPGALANTQKGYCTYHGQGAATCCSYYSNGHRRCQEWTYDCSRPDMCGWHRSGEAYEPDGCLYLANPVQDDVVLDAPPQLVQEVLLLIEGPSFYVPEPVGEHMPGQLP